MEANDCNDTLLSRATKTRQAIKLAALALKRMCNPSKATALAQWRSVAEHSKRFRTIVNSIVRCTRDADVDMCSSTGR